MGNIAGIKFTKDAKKNNRYVTFDLKKHGDAVNPLLHKLGAIEEDETALRKAVENGMTGDEFWNSIKNTISEHFKNKD